MSIIFTLFCEHDSSFVTATLIGLPAADVHVGETQLIFFFKANVKLISCDSLGSQGKKCQTH